MSIHDFIGGDWELSPIFPLQLGICWDSSCPEKVTVHPCMGDSLFQRGARIDQSHSLMLIPESQPKAIAGSV